MLGLAFSNQKMKHVCGRLAPKPSVYLTGHLVQRAPLDAIRANTNKSWTHGKLLALFAVHPGGLDT